MSNTEPRGRIIKVIYPHVCPHCSKDILVSIRMLAPGVDWVLRKEDMEKAKEKVRAAIAEAPIEETKKAEILSWVNSEDTLFGPEEVQAIIDQMIDGDKEETTEE